MAIKTKIVFCILVSTALLSQMSVVATTVSISDAQVGPSGTIVLPIMIYDVTNVSGAYINMSFDQSVVYVTAIGDSDLNLTTYRNINNNSGFVGYAAINWPSALGGPNITFANVTLEAVGGVGDSCLMALNVVSMQDANYSEIPRTIVNGTFTISDLVQPLVTNPSSNPNVIPVDTDDDPRWGENSMLNVTVTDSSGVSQVTVDLSLIGGLEAQQMTNIGSNTWSVTTSAPSETSPGTYNLLVIATDIYNNTNSTVSIGLDVALNGDVIRDGKVDLNDGISLINHVLLVPGYDDIEDGLAEVTGDGVVVLDDGIYLVNNAFGISGYETLR